MSENTKQRSISTTIRKGVGLLILLALAAVFIVSGWSKMQTLEPFSWSFIDLFPVGFTGASVLARLAIGLEWLIAGLLLGHIALRKLAYPATLALLLLFSVYLLGLLITYGNQGNCGCFGEWLYMKPAAALLKNAGMMLAVLVLWKIYPGRNYTNAIYIGLALTIAAFTLPFILDPVPIFREAERSQEPIDLSPIYSVGKPAPTVDLRKGKHVILFFSTTCPHCKKAAYLAQILHRRYPELPLFMVLNGNEELKKEFIGETHAAELPQTLISNTPEFQMMAGEYVPTIYWVNNGVIERKSNYFNLQPDDVKAWLRGK